MCRYSCLCNGDTLLLMLLPAVSRLHNMYHSQVENNLISLNIFSGEREVSLKNMDTLKLFLSILLFRVLKSPDTLKHIKQYCVVMLLCFSDNPLKDVFLYGLVGGSHTVLRSGWQQIYRGAFYVKGLSTLYPLLFLSAFKYVLILFKCTNWGSEVILFS